jgi:hypothetical protein
VHPVDPSLESARFQPWSLPLDPSRKTGHKLCFFKRDLYRYGAGMSDEDIGSFQNRMGELGFGRGISSFSYHLRTMKYMLDLSGLYLG